MQGRSGGREGFTLVEMIISIGLFSVISTIAVGGFANALRTQRQATALITANSNVSLAIEQMSREIRTGYDFCVNGQNCPTANQLSFRNSRREQVTYCFQSAAIFRNLGNACGGQKITADNIAIQHLFFYLQGHVASDGNQPRITIAIGVSPAEANLTGNRAELQTTISPRFPLDT